MADAETKDVVMQETEVLEEVTDKKSAVKRVLKHALQADGLVRGLKESVQYIEAGKAEIVFLSESCDEPEYKKLITALTNQNQIPLFMVPDSKELGQWAGLCKIDSEGNPLKPVGTSCVVVFDHGEDNAGLKWLVKNGE
jgi:small subunit ribosomal protein S12e